MTSNFRSSVGLLVLATLVHGGLLAAVQLKKGSIEVYAFQSIDCLEYYAIAANLVEHGAFSQDEQPPFRTDTWRTPGYPLFLAAIMSAAGKSPTAIVVAQQLLSILNVALLFWIVRGRMSDRRTLLVAVLLLLEPYHLYYSLWLMSTTLQTSVVLGIWLAHERSVKPLWQGLLCGALVLIWPGAVLVPVAVFVLLVARSWRSRAAKTLDPWMKPVRFGWVCGVSVSTWMLRNAIVAGAFALSHQSGIVLAYFKATEVILWREGRTADRYLETSLDPRHDQHPHRVWESIDRVLGDAISAEGEVNWRKLAQGNRTGLDSFIISRALTRMAIDAAFDKPLGTLTCCVTRMGEILTFPLDLAVAPPNGVTVNRWRSAFIGGGYALLAVCVLVRLIRDRSRLAGIAFPMACTLALLLAATPQTDPRFRVPMIPMLLFLALVPRRGTTGDCQADRPGEAKGERDTRIESC